MNNQPTHRIWVEDLGTFVHKKTRFTGTEKQMIAKRNSLQAYFTNLYGDGVVRVYVAPITTYEPQMKEPQMYHVYNKDGWYRGAHIYDIAAEMCTAHADWTMVEVNENARKS